MLRFLLLLLIILVPLGSAAQACPESCPTGEIKCSVSALNVCYCLPQAECSTVKSGVELPAAPGNVNTSDTNGNSSGRLVNPLKVDTIEGLLTIVLGAVVQIGSILLVLALVYVGYLFVAAQGNTEQLKKAREALVWTVVGGIVLLGAQAIAIVIETTVQSL